MHSDQSRSLHNRAKLELCLLSNLHFKSCMHKMVNFYLNRMINTNAATILLKLRPEKKCQAPSGIRTYNPAISVQCSPNWANEAT